jgi:hypothetical protein
MSRFGDRLNEVGRSVERSSVTGALNLAHLGGRARPGKRARDPGMVSALRAP